MMKLTGVLHINDTHLQAFFYPLITAAPGYVCGQCCLFRQSQRGTTVRFHCNQMLRQ